MSNGQEDGPMLLEELEVVVGGLSRPWAGFWQPADLAGAVTATGDPDVTAPMATSAGDQ
jgi:hypothetical protein